MHAFDILWCFKRDGLWWACIRQANAVFDAVLTAQALNGLVNIRDETYTLFQFVTIDGDLIRVLGLGHESDALNKLLQVPEENGS